MYVQRALAKYEQYGEGGLHPIWRRYMTKNNPPTLVEEEETTEKKGPACIQISWNQPEPYRRMPGGGPTIITQRDRC